MARKATPRKVARAAAGDVRPEDLPAHKCGHYGHKSKRTKRLCRAQVVAGTQHCKDHAGKTLEQHRAEGQIRLEAAAMWTLDGHDGSGLDPRVEILRLIAFWKWKANLYGKLLQEAYAAAESLRKAHQAGALLLAEPEEETRFDGEGEYDGVRYEHPSLQVARADLERIFITGGVTALVGHKYDVDRDGRVFAVDEGIRGLVQLEQKAHELVGKFCHLAVQAKVAETRIEMAQHIGVMIQAVILGVLRDLDIAATERKVQDLIVAHIDMVTSGPMAIAA